MRMRRKRNAHGRFTPPRRFGSRSAHFFGPTPFPYIYCRLYVNDSELSGCSCLGSLVFGWPRSQLSLSRPSAVSSSLPGPAAVCLVNTSTLLVMSRCDEQRILEVMPSILLCIPPNDGGE